jgi:hypothetical protein
LRKHHTLFTDFNKLLKVKSYLCCALKEPMKYLIALAALFAFGTSKSQAYWQQEVNYTIRVTLDDRSHMLRGQETFEYVNNSPDALDFLYIHLWPNAYSSSETALARQLYQNGEKLLAFGPDSIKGYIDSLSFTVNGQGAMLSLDENNPDIAKLLLPQPLPSGGRITVATPFRVKIPSGEISRLGHIGQSYQITQWYPKPAVYDKNGWNQMPYLNQGEFYSEYGSFDVSITLPKNYVVGATGDLQTQSEMDFLDDLAQNTAQKLSGSGIDKASRSFPPSDPAMKTIRYKQSKVHDFAWFADKRYLVLKGEVELPESKRKVTSWAMFTPKNAELWKGSVEYINDATFWYSKWNGDYPYDQVTAVDGTISAGGGMEYPNVTVIGNCSSAMELEIVIVHEVGHNWFYGILGSNERVHGWMDEGMNTLNELRYVYTKYPENEQLSQMVLGGRFHFEDLSHYDQGDYSFRLLAGLGEDQPVETHSADFTSANYGIVMYQKTGLVFNYLKQYLGDATFDGAMHNYYETWKFRHPQPEDMKQSLERSTGRDLGWLFGDLIQTTDHIDYGISHVRQENGKTIVGLKNSGQVNGPVEIGGYRNGELVQTVWAEPFEKRSQIALQDGLDEVRLNPSGRIPELRRQNDYWKSAGLIGRWEKPQLEFLIGDPEPARNNLFWSPVFGANVYDKFMLGAALHNFTVPGRPFQFLLAPMYSFGGQRISGISEFAWTFLPSRNIRLSRFGLSLKSFKETDLTAKRNDGYYYAIMPYWFAKLGDRKAATPFSHTLLVQTMLRVDKADRFRHEQLGGYVKYDMAYRRADHRLNVSLRTDYLVADLDTKDQLGRSSAEVTYRYKYMKNEQEKWLELRAYAGKNWLFDFGAMTNPYRYCLNLSGADGTQDLFLEDYFFGRTETKGFLSQQRLENMGGFKSPTNIGTNSDWVAAANFYMQLPALPKVVGIFADAGIYPNGLNGKATGAYDAGVALRFGTFFGLYFPVISSQNMEDLYPSKNYTTRIRMTLKLNPVNKPLRLGNLF